MLLHENVLAARQLAMVAPLLAKTQGLHAPSDENVAMAVGWPTQLEDVSHTRTHTEGIESGMGSQATLAPRT